MAEHTDQNLLHQVIYSVFVRNHTKEGTFRALEGDLDRLKGRGADIIWRMPIHPIGSEGRKGTLGSPYAIQDYRGRASYAISLSAPVSRMTDQRVAELRAPLMAARDEIARALGGSRF